MDLSVGYAKNRIININKLWLFNLFFSVSFDIFSSASSVMQLCICVLKLRYCIFVVFCEISVFVHHITIWNFSFYFFNFNSRYEFMRDKTYYIFFNSLMLHFYPFRPFQRLVYSTTWNIETHKSFVNEFFLGHSKICIGCFKKHNLLLK